jgi:hypothetical protein
MARCMGACCDRIQINTARTTLRRWLDTDAYDRNQAAERAEHALIWTLLKPIPGATPTWGRESVYSCRALAATGCVLTHGERPSMCRDFPYGGLPCCPHCGAASDAEARGVALQTSGAPS